MPQAEAAASAHAAAAATIPTAAAITAAAAAAGVMDAVACPDRQPSCCCRRHCLGRKDLQLLQACANDAF
jgi:hypothetical protein